MQRIDGFSDIEIYVSDADYLVIRQNDEMGGGQQFLIPRRFLPEFLAAIDAAVAEYETHADAIPQHLMDT